MTETALALDAFPPLPGADGDERKDGRRTGIEIEFGDLDDEPAAAILRDCLGGDLSHPKAGQWRLEDSRIGGLDLYLDTRLRPEATSEGAELAVDIARRVVPLEIVTEPLARSRLPLVERMMDALSDAGASGSRDGLLYGFGLHLNVELADPENGTDMPRTALAFALLEPWLRARDPLDVSRRVLPFTRIFPGAFVDALAEMGGDADLGHLLDAVDAHISDRNHGLDLLPAYAHLAPDRFARRQAEAGAVKARPTYHYRMPETRFGTPGWSLGYEWRRWILAERVAADPDCLSRLCALRGDFENVPLRPPHQDWQDRMTEALGPLAQLAPEGGPGAPQ
ncbi:amidoligase family protein [Roseisalinus antarcticus]|uniref:amidoligase family protein n=1 Tax=Roseisalinus antarcticus TaxID=254357 RepID=UPI0013565C96|nr:amidoligase family protein [Roseisalinus antarcticus]